MRWMIFLLLGSSALIAQADLPFFTIPDGVLSVSRKAIISNNVYFSLFSGAAPEKRLNIINRHSKEEVDGDLLLIIDDDILMATHYFHFMEHLVGIWNFLIDKNADQVKEILFCLKVDSEEDRLICSRPYEIDQSILKALFPNAKIGFFKDLHKKIQLKARNIHVSSRPRSHKIPEAGYGNMNGSARFGYKPESLRQLRDLRFDKMGIQVEPRGDRLRITYCQRKITRLPRIMEPTIEGELLESISQATGYPVNVVDFAEISFREQLQIVANTDLFMGVHGNGLTHLLFLPDDATVLEYYEGGESAFFRLFSQLRGLHYYGNSHDSWVTESNQSIENRAPYQGNVTGIDLEGTLNLIRKLQM